LTGMRTSAARAWLLAITITATKADRTIAMSPLAGEQ
jgi:hypothetical protein